MSRIALSDPPKPLQRVEKFMRGAAGERINTIQWAIPEPRSTECMSPYPEVTGAVLFCHGYGHYSSLTYDWLAAVLRTFGIAAFGIDHMGHGKSQGVPAFIPQFAQVVSDVLSWAAIIRDSLVPAGTPLFGYGESLGGGILLHVALVEPEAFAGLTLFAPMVGIDADRVPNPVVQTIGKIVAWLAPTAAVAPVKDLLPDCFRDAAMLPIARADPHRYVGAMRIGTAFQLKDAMDELSVRFSDITTPFLILHGTGDRITSPAASAQLFDVSKSLDKSIILYEGAFHVMWCESIDTREHILHDWLDWLLQRTGPRRESLPPQVACKQTRPAGSSIFAAAGHPLTLFSLQTHSQLYTSSNPQERPEWAGIDAHPLHQRSHPRHHWHPSYGYPHHGPLRLSLDKSIVTG